MDYVPGVGIPTGLRYATTSVMAAITGDGDTGCSAKIKEVYKVGQVNHDMNFPMLTRL